jgi:drug/metabolite transporter (DMT)-like permease
MKRIDAPALFSGDRRSTRSSGLAIAAATAVISGVSVFINSYGVHHYHSPAVYTTAKNIVASVLLLGVALIARSVRGASRPEAPRSDSAPRPTIKGIWRVIGLAYVGIIGGGVAFIMFFNGLAHTAAAPAAFLHDTLVLFVGVFSWLVLRERITVLNLAAVGVLIIGEVAVTGGIGHLGVGDGPSLILAATALWAIETVVAKRLLSELSATTVALTRMGVGVGVLVCYLAATGTLGQLGHLNRAQVAWAGLTGITLAAYVATWFAALARARAVDVTSVLVGSVIVTSLLQRVAGHGLPSPAYLGLGLIIAGVAATVALAPGRSVA